MQKKRKKLPYMIEKVLLKSCLKKVRKTQNSNVYYQYIVAVRPGFGPVQPVLQIWASKIWGLKIFFG
jgi:hypothetical protein